MSWTYGTIVAEQYHRLKRTGALGQGCNIQSFPGVLKIISSMNGWWSDKCTQSISREVHDGSSSGWDTVQIMFANLKHRTYSHRFFQTTCLCAQNVTGLDNLRTFFPVSFPEATSDTRAVLMSPDQLALFLLPVRCKWKFLQKIIQSNLVAS